MIFKISTGFKKFIIITVAILGLGLVLVDNRPAGAGASNDRAPNEGKQRSNAMIVGQSETRTSAPETNSPTSESSEPESRTQEEQNAAAAKKKPLKDFQPTEKIEADQAVDFPYDI
jgi:hypothetical protein